MHGLRQTQEDVIAVYRPPSQFLNLGTILIEKLQEVMQTKNLLLIGDFNAPNVKWNDMTTSCHDATFDARILCLCLDNFLVQHSV